MIPTLIFAGQHSQNLQTIAFWSTRISQNYPIYLCHYLFIVIFIPNGMNLHRTSLHALQQGYLSSVFRSRRDMIFDTLEFLIAKPEARIPRLSMKQKAALARCIAAREDALDLTEGKAALAELRASGEVPSPLVEVKARLGL